MAWPSRAVKVGAVCFCAPTAIDYHHVMARTSDGTLVTSANWWCAAVAVAVLLAAPQAWRRCGPWLLAAPRRKLWLYPQATDFWDRVSRLPRKGQVLYRFYGVGRRGLYAGITGSPRHRFRQHAGLARDFKQKEWWNDADRVLLTYYWTRWGVERAEKRAIRSEHPVYNIAHAGRAGVT